MRIATRRRHRRWGFFKKPNQDLMVGAVVVLGVGLFSASMLLVRMIELPSSTYRASHQSPSLASLPSAMQSAIPSSLGPQVDAVAGGVPAYMVNVEMSLKGYDNHLRDNMTSEDIQELKNNLTEKQIERIRPVATDP